MNILWILLCITLSVGFYYWGKHKGMKEKQADHWLEIDRLKMDIEMLQGVIKDTTKKKGRPKKV